MVVAAEATGKEKWPARLLVAPIPRSRCARPRQIALVQASRKRRKRVRSRRKKKWIAPALTSCASTDSSVARTIPSTTAPISIYVRGNFWWVMNVTILTTVRDVKVFLEDKEGFPVAAQRVLHAKKELCDDDTVAECGVVHESSLLVGGRIRGGGGSGGDIPESRCPIGCRVTRSHAPTSSSINRVKYMSSEDEDGNRKQHQSEVPPSPRPTKHRGRRSRSVVEPLGAVFVADPETLQQWQWSNSKAKQTPSAVLEEPLRKFYCEYTPMNGRARCSLPECAAKILPNSVRIACEPSADNKYRRWYHTKCFFAHTTKGPSPNRGLLLSKQLTCQDCLEDEELDDIYNWIEDPPHFTLAY